MENIKHAILSFMLGDIIGFANGINEFNEGTVFSSVDEGAEYSNKMVFTFFNEGGFSKHPKKSWSISDDTIMLFANALGLIKWKDHGSDDLSMLINIIKNYYIEIIKDKQLLETFENVHKAGITTLNSLKKLKAGDDYKTFAYNEKAGGNGGSMRSGIIGIVFWKPDDLLSLIEVAIESTCLTHVNAIAFLGSVSVALFASYAMQQIPIIRWPMLMVELLESDVIDNYINVNKNHIMSFYKRDKQIFINKWRDYIEDKFSMSHHVYKKNPIMQFPSKRSLYYNKFSYKPNDIYPGASGDDSVIIAYDCLIDSDGSWEKVVLFSMLHVGDSDSTGCICGLLYGLTYGTDNINKIMVNNINLEYNEALNIISKLEKIV